LELLDEVLVAVLGHLAALISVEEDIVNIEGGSNKGLLVSSGDGNRGGRGGKGVSSPETFAKRADIKVDLDLVVLKSYKRKSKSRVSVEPEKKRNIESGLRKGVSRSANLGRSTGSSARTRDSSEGRISDIGKLSGITNELEVSTLLLRGHGELVPDVHPVTILAINSLTSNLDLDLGNKLLTDVV
jgi:hypothetical protein